MGATTVRQVDLTAHADSLTAVEGGQPEACEVGGRVEPVTCRTTGKERLRGCAVCVATLDIQSGRPGALDSSAVAAGR